MSDFSPHSHGHPDALESLRAENRDLLRRLQAAESTLLRLEAILFGSRDIMSFVDSEYVYRAVNQEYLRAYRCAREEIVGRTVSEIMGAEVFGALVKDKLDRCLAGEEVSYCAWFEHPGLGRTFREVVYRPFREQDGSIGGVLVNARDLTQAIVYEEKLSTEREKLFNIFEQLPALVYVQRPDHSIDFSNRRFRELFGDVTGKHCYEVMTLRNTPCPECRTRKVFQTQTPMECEWTVFNGRIFQVYIHPFHDVDGLPLVLELGIDITERKGIEQRLKINEKRLQLALESTSDGLWDWNIRSGEVYYSPRWFTLLGFAPGSLPAAFETWVELLHPEDRERAVAQIWDHIHRKRATAEAEFRMRTKSGDWRWMLHRGRIVERDANGAATRLIGTLIDITERKSAEERMRLHKQLLETLLHMNHMTEATVQEILEFSLQEAVAATRSEYGFLGFVSETQEVMILHSWSSGALGACTLQDPPLYFPLTQAGLWADAVRQRGPFLINDYAGFRSPSKKGLPEGHPPLARLLVVPVLDENKVLALAAVANKPELYDDTDIAQLSLLLNGMWDHVKRKRSIAQLVAAKEEAESATRAKGQFLANMSHELRTPLTGIIGLTDLLSSSNLREDQAPFIEMLRETSMTLLTLINDILDFSKVEAKCMELRPADFDLQLELEKQMGTFTHEASTKGCGLSLALAPDVPARLHGDSVRLGQVVGNLLSNAVKFTEKGAINLSVERVPTPANGITLRFTVSDSGIGIPLEIQDTIFDCFTQADGSYAKRYHGAGLGLAICKELVRLMGGQIGVQSAPDQGSAFSFTASFGHATDQGSRKILCGATAPTLTSPQPQKQLKILLAEDNRLSQVILTHFFKESGHTVVTVNNGSQALDALCDQAFDCVVMDIQMPEMDGVTVARRIRSEENRRFDPNIPIVALTAYTRQEDRDRFLEAGMNDYLPKPVDMSRLMRVILNAVSGRQGRPDTLDSSPAGVSSADILDEAKLCAAFRGKPEVFREIKELFAASTRANLQLVTESLDPTRPCDFESMSTAAHSLANSAMVIRSAPAMQCARELEQAAREKSCERARDCHERLKVVLGLASERLATLQV